MTNNNYLAHYGVKGMKWGVRKKRSKALFNYETKSKKKKRVADELSKMDDAQLQQRLNRMRNEQAYRELSGLGGSKYGDSMKSKVREAITSEASKPVKQIAGYAVAAGTAYALKYAQDNFRS